MTIQADLFIRFVALEKSGADDEFVTRKMPVYLGIFALAQQVFFRLSNYILLTIAIVYSNSAWR